MGLEIASDKLVRISYSAIAAFLMGVAGFAAWMTSMENRLGANTESVAEAKVTAKDIDQTLISIDRRLYVIEQLLKTSNK